MTRFALKQYWLLLLTSLFLVACDNSRPFDEEFPHAVRIRSFRNYFDAENARKRLAVEGANAFVICTNSATEGKFFHLLGGASRRMEAAMAEKIDYEDRLKIKNLGLVHFKNYKKEMQPLNEESWRGNLPQIPKQNLPDVIQLMLNQLPFKSNYNLKQATLLIPNAHTDITQHPHAKSLAASLPNNIVLDDLLRFSAGIFEGNYDDILTNKKITLHLCAIQYASNEKLADKFATKLLANKKFSFEQKSPVHVPASESLDGFWVSYAPNKKTRKLCLILSDTAQKFLLIIQSSGNNREEMTNMAMLFGESPSINEYPSFHNSFQLLPSTNIGNDELFLFHFEPIIQHPIKKLNGNIEASFYFHHKTGNWQASFVHLNEEKDVNEVFEKMYAKSDSKKEEIEFGKRKGYATYLRRKDKYTEKITDADQSYQIQSKYYIGQASNNATAWLTHKELRERLAKFRLP